MRELEDLNIKKYSLLILYLIFTVFMLTGEEQSFIFPFIGKVYSFEENKKELKVELETPHYFSKEYFQRDGESYLIDQTNRQLFILKNGELTKLELGNFSNIFLSKNYLLKISYTFFEEGFKGEIYKLQSGSEPVKQKSFFIDLFISDYTIIGDTIILVGSTKNNFYNKVYRINLTKGTSEELFSMKKESSFLKIIKGKNTVTFYRSSRKINEEKSVYRVDIKELTTGEAKKLPIKEHKVKSKDKTAFFGKGFARGDNLYIPAIDKKNDITLTELNHELKLISETSLPTGLYKVVYNNQKVVYFLGYNYYKSRGAFQLAGFDLDKMKVLYYKELSIK